MPATIARWGNSAGLRIPAEALRKSGLKVGDQVETEVQSDHSIVIRGVTPRPTRAEILGKVTAMIAAIEPSTLPDVTDIDDIAAGKEVW